MNYRLMSEEYQPVTDNPTAWFVCPQCGYNRVKFPSRPEVWKQYQAEGIVDVRQEVVDIAYVVARSDADFLKAMAFYIPTVVGSLVLQQLGLTSPLFTAGVVSVGAAVLYLVAARHHLVWGIPKTQAPPAAAAQSETLPEITEMHEHHGKNSDSLFMFSKRAATYKSGDRVPDYYLWQVARAYQSGVPFSRQMYSSENRVISQPAFLALRDAFVAAGIAHTDGQDMILTARARNVLGQWARMDRPPIPMENPRIGTVRPHSPAPNLGV